MSRDQLHKFLRLLKVSPSGAVFNPWWQIDDGNDIGSHCPVIRRKHLAVYFGERLGKARLAIVGEALGYRGGSFQWNCDDFGAHAAWEKNRDCSGGLWASKS